MKMFNQPTPGEFIAEMYLQANSLNARQFAAQLGVLNDQTRITPEMAERLSKVVGRSVGSWILLQEIQDRWQERLRNAA
ncbi:transcriptional regulator [Duganella sp. BuS-21]|uniref:helix-turn-helix transcriptional regulator n=1 Tax=Duganella sp. BuS-21 TaxID=2943848 RepID=UPI0035A6C50D